MKRGRPVKSRIRQNIVEILNYLKEGYGYEIHKIYSKIFPSCTRENIYYNLKKGVDINVFRVKEIRQEQGNYSWGGVVKKIIYVLGSEAKPEGSSEVKEFFEKNK